MSTDIGEEQDLSDVVDVSAIQMSGRVAGYGDDRSRTIALIVQADRFKKVLRSGKSRTHLTYVDGITRKR